MSWPTSRWPSCFYSLSRETYSGTRRPTMACLASWPFLFAVARDVQRNGESSVLPHSLGLGFYSLSRETYSGTNCMPNMSDAQVNFVSIRCRARRTAERIDTTIPQVWDVSIRCRARRTAEPSSHVLRLRAASAVSIRCRARRTAELVSARNGRSPTTG